jgi:hypothetical protein
MSGTTRRGVIRIDIGCFLLLARGSDHTSVDTPDRMAGTIMSAPMAGVVGIATVTRRRIVAYLVLIFGIVRCLIPGITIIVVTTFVAAVMMRKWPYTHIITD